MIYKDRTVVDCTRGICGTLSAQYPTDINATETTVPVLQENHVPSDFALSITQIDDYMPGHQLCGSEVAAGGDFSHGSESINHIRPGRFFRAAETIGPTDAAGRFCKWHEHQRYRHYCMDVYRKVLNGSTNACGKVLCTNSKSETFISSDTNVQRKGNIFILLWR
jgi:hypothetical protein